METHASVSARGNSSNIGKNSLTAARHHRGPIQIQYETNGDVRRSIRSQRKRTLVVKAKELSVKCGGSVFVQYRDENGHVFSFATDDNIWNEYISNGIQPSSSERRMTYETDDSDRPVKKTKRVGTQMGDCGYAPEAPATPQEAAEGPVELDTSVEAQSAVIQIQTPPPGSNITLPNFEELVKSQVGYRAAEACMSKREKMRNNKDKSATLTQRNIWDVINC